MTDDLTRERMSRDLRSAAREIRLEPGSELSVVTTGKRRRRRRNRLTAFAAVGALAAGTGVVVQQLSQTDDTSIQIGEGEETLDETVEEVPAPVETTPSTEPANPDATWDPAVDEAAGGGGDIDAPPAELVESNMVWRVVEPDAAQAVGMALYSNPWTEFGDGILLSTAPGRSDDFKPMFWRSEDGITWTEYDIDVPFGGRERIVFDGGSVYTVGTAPGIAETDPNPLIVAWSDDEGQTWHETVLPVDTNAGREVPTIDGVGVSSSVHPLDAGGVIVLVQHYANLDWNLVMSRLAELGYPQQTDYMDQDARGLHVLADQSCTIEQSGPVVAPTTVPGTVPPDGEYVVPDEFGGCPLRTITWEELGIPAEAVTLTRSPVQQAFYVVGGELTEVPIPADTSPAWFAQDGTGPLVMDRQGRYYRVTAGGVVEEQVNVPEGWIVGQNDTTEFAVSDVQTGAFTSSRQRIGSRSSGEWTWSDWSSLVDESRLTYTMSQAVGPTGLVSVLNSTEDPILAQGGVSVTIDGVKVSRSSQRVDPEIVIEATGEVVPFERLQYSERGIEVLDADGNVVAELTGPDFERAIWGCCAEQQDQRLYVATTADGRHVAVESIAELLGVADSDVASVTRVTPVGQTVVIAVSLQDRHPDGSHRQLVLVGTPAS